MSEIKFSCPYCAQHIVCDEAYCRHAIPCPGCDQSFFVPPLAAFLTSSGGALTLTLPVGSKAIFQPHIPTLGAWDESEWNKHFVEATGEEQGIKSALWLLLLAPFPLALALRSFLGLPFSGILICFLLSGLVAGFVWARLMHKTGVQFLLFALPLSIAMMMAYVGVAVAILFAGCVLL